VAPVRDRERPHYAADVPLYRLEQVPEPFSAPVVVAAFDGWIDAAGAASTAADMLARGAELIATFDGNVLFDYRSRRPTLDVVDGTLTRLVWPALELHRRSAGDRDLLVLHGAEPDFRWKELGDDILQLCVRLGVTEWVSLGSIPAAVPHTRAVPVMATASAGAGLDETETKGPPGLLRVPSAGLSAMEVSITDGGIPAVGFYAQVPHYIGGPYAAATLALLQHLARHLRTELPLGSLDEDARSQRERLDAAVADDDDVRAILAQLENASEEEIPSGDELAAEIERFLRNEGPGTIPPS
jgi:PAC2 family